MKPLAMMTAGLVLLPLAAFAQVQADRSLLEEIRAIRAIDNHSHVLAGAPAGALPADGSLGVTPFVYPVRLRVDNPEWMRAWRSLYGVEPAGMDLATGRDVLRRKQELMRERGAGWAASILDHVSIDTALVNMPAPAVPPSPRFRWVPTANALVYPFGGVDADPDVGTIEPPATLEKYATGVIRETVQRWRRDGAVAVKLSLAYSRSLDFRNVPAADAARVYARHLSKRAVSPADYTALQDYLFHVLAREAGAAGLAMHIHTGIGADAWFRIAGANPLLLEDAVSDPALRATQFVLIHGGWPFDRQAGVMLIKPNVYADFSAQTFLRSPRALSETLRAWLAWYPEKVLFGSDAYPDPNTPLSGWEEMLWLANDSARMALAIALTGMMNDGEITRVRAGEIARMVLRDNARKLYRLDQAEQTALSRSQ